MIAGGDYVVNSVHNFGNFYSIVVLCLIGDLGLALDF